MSVDFYLTHKCGPECAPVECPCGKGDAEKHLFPDDHAELAEVGMFCVKCDDWCERYKKTARASSQ